MIPPNTYDDLFYRASEQYGVSFSWLKAIAGAESDWNPRAYRAEPHINDASRGLMQLLLKTARSLGYTGEPDGLYDPATNIDLGAKLISENVSRFGDSFERVYSAYNSGSPTAYLSNADVKAHLDRALTYLSAVLDYTVEVEAEPDNSGTVELGAALAIAAVLGAALFYITR
jgi:soluble lytic murein transglycosylase-like protein